MCNQPTNHNLTSPSLPNNNTMSQVGRRTTSVYPTRNGEFGEELVMVAGGLWEMDG